MGPPYKSQLNDVEQKYEWRTRAREQGLDLRGLREQSEERQETNKEQPKLTGEDAVKSAIHHLSERDTTFTKTALIDEALKAGLGDVSHADIEAAIESRAGGLLSAGELDRGEGKKEPQFTTKSAVYREAEILQRARDGQGNAEAIISTRHSAQGQENQDVVPDVSFTKEELKDGKRDSNARSEISGIEEVEPLTGQRVRGLSERGLDADEIGQNSGVLSGDARSGGPRDQHLRRPDDDERVSKVISDFEAKKGFSMSDGQKAAVALTLTSEDNHMGIVGAAGAGKTTAMEAIVEQYKAAGYEVIGVAPSAAAAKELQSAGCDDTRTLASSLLKKEETKEGENPKRLYILDEAGMVSAKDMDAFIRKADAEGARTILVGDPLQLAAVEAGSPYAQMLKTGAIAHADIDEIQRQKDPQLREIAQAFARGDAAKGVELARPYMLQVELDKNDLEPDADAASIKKAKIFAMADAAAREYLSLSPEERQKTLLLAGTNASRQAINDKIRIGLREEGTLGKSIRKITALDKLDLTREAATRAEHYVAKDGAQVVVQFNSDLKDKDANTNKDKDAENQFLAKKDSQWDVVATDGGKLHLRSRDDPEKTIEMLPTDARISAYSAREMELRAGDRVVFRQNDKERGVTNGMQGTVGIDEKGRLGIKTDAGKFVPISEKRGQTLDYSYARTVHSSQGATVERAIVVGEASRVATAESAYVACSREKTGLTIITDDAEKLSKAWGKFADRQAALDASKIQPPETLEEIQKARAMAGHELGRVGDLAQARAMGNTPLEEEQEQQQAEEQSKQDHEAATGGSSHESGDSDEKEDNDHETAQAEPELELEIGD